MQPVSTFWTGVLHPFSAVVNAKPVQSINRRNGLLSTGACNTKHLQKSLWWCLELQGHSQETATSTQETPTSPPEEEAMDF